MPQSRARKGTSIRGQNGIPEAIGAADAKVQILPFVVAPYLVWGLFELQCGAQGLCLPVWPLTRLAQKEERGCAGRETGGRGGLVKGAPEMSVAPPTGQDRIMIYGPKSDGIHH